MTDAGLLIAISEGRMGEGEVGAWIWGHGSSDLQVVDLI
jgi:hypothetical protein